MARIVRNRFGLIVAVLLSISVGLTFWLAVRIHNVPLNDGHLDFRRGLEGTDPTNKDGLKKSSAIHLSFADTNLTGFKEHAVNDQGLDEGDDDDIDDDDDDDTVDYNEIDTNNAHDQVMDATVDSSDEEDDEISPAVQHLLEDPDRGPIWKILYNAGYDLDNQTLFSKEALDSFPNLTKVTSFYGPPAILGLETCATYQRLIPAKKRRFGVAGTFNAGTNFLFDVLNVNCWNPARKKKRNGMSNALRWQVPWGKHLPADQRLRRTVKRYRNVNQTTILPIVTVRDPMTWMQSMCRHGYSANFDHLPHHCPNLIPYKEDIELHPRFAKMKHIPVFVKYDKNLTVKHESLAHMWNEWYALYLNTTTFPRLIVRMEDVIFHADTVIPQVCRCIGGEWFPDISLKADVANRNNGVAVGMQNGLLRALTSYGNITKRREGYPANQLQAAKDILDPAMMKTLQYPYEEP